MSFDAKEWEAIPNLINNARTTIRGLIKTHFANVDHNDERKVQELAEFLQSFRFVTKKWNVEILYELELHDGLTFNELRRHLGNVSARTLSDCLKQLNDYGLVNRELLDTRPPSVRYHLDDGGKGFIELSLLLIFHLFNIQNKKRNDET